ncbi:vesicle-associated membrane protein-associated protein A-like [Limulus polyphemus]|uniref:Vesicle-associated membrane protein-associated protein A-like n=1 Tax=Limulus polyphemus TaxID=6850 RepID=A0ABM1B945_LIMPO|nr:vesicle-associated membrane protein-associated protein A-like [Limulus polyphemus]
MSKLLEQVLQLDPDTELHFKGPFTDVVTSYLSLYNPSERRVCFKVKTTAPKRYCVRPNSGFIEPKETVRVAVMLQPFDYDPLEKNKHKFMVQTMFAPNGDVSLETLWKDANSENLMDSKLKCVFDPPPDKTPQDNLDPNTGHVEEKSLLIKPSSDTVPKSSPKASSADQELKKVQEECKRLKDELAELQQLNSKLKEEGPRQRIARGITESSSVIQKRDSSHSDKVQSTSTTVPSAGSEELQQPTSMMFLVVIVAIFILGFLMGKFLL